MTSNPKRYKNPPIKEAIFSLVFKEPLSNNILDLFKEDEYIKSKFPNNNAGIEIKFTPNQDPKKTNISQTNAGYILKGENTLLNTRPTQLSYHVLSHYTCWEDTIAEVIRIWNRFLNYISNCNIQQIAVRYVNQIAIPMPGNIQEYVKLLPMIPPGINPKLDNFFIQINTSNTGGELKGIITETLLPIQSKNNLSFLLDINVFKTCDYNSDNTEIWKTFDKIHSFKNELFRSCITEKTENLFE